MHPTSRFIENSMRFLENENSMRIVTRAVAIVGGVVHAIEPRLVRPPACEECSQATSVDASHQLIHLSKYRKRNDVAGIMAVVWRCTLPGAV